MPACATSCGFGDHLGDVQQRLRRDAADVQAHAAQRRVALDQHHLLAEIGGAERRGVAAGPGAEHQHLGVDVAFGRRWARAACGVAAQLAAAFAGLRRVRAAAAGAAARGACGRATSSSSVRISVPCGDLVADLDPAAPSPRRRFGAGTSIVALSDSSVMSGSSFATASPGLAPAPRSPGCS